jgi:hypothetical protein
MQRFWQYNPHKYRLARCELAILFSIQFSLIWHLLHYEATHSFESNTSPGLPCFGNFFKYLTRSSSASCQMRFLPWNVLTRNGPTCNDSIQCRPTKNAVNRYVLVISWMRLSHSNVSLYFHCVNSVRIVTCISVAKQRLGKQASIIDKLFSMESAPRLLLCNGSVNPLQQ